MSAARLRVVSGGRDGASAAAAPGPFSANPTIAPGAVVGLLRDEGARVERRDGGLTERFLSPGQEKAARAVREWLAAPGGKRIFRLFGYAGTGKTSVARLLADDVPGGAVYCAFTGKAALQMRRSGCEGASTIHSLIYSPVELEDGTVRFVLDRDSEAKRAGIIVVDECSMVDGQLADDLLSFGKPLLVLGDPAQLPPVGGEGVLTAAPPDAMLTEIHRQAADNPIIRWATTVREGGSLALGDDGAVRVVPSGALPVEEVVRFDQVLVGTHRRRLAYIGRMREALGFGGGLPGVGERLICTRNDRSKGIFNGGMFEASEVAECRPSRTVKMRVLSKDGYPRRSVEVEVRRELFDAKAEPLPGWMHKGLQQFDYGHAITVHKAQGSQWDSVLVYDESRVFREDGRRWLYTALTRASERLTVVLL